MDDSDRAYIVRILTKNKNNFNSKELLEKIDDLESLENS